MRIKSAEKVGIGSGRHMITVKFFASLREEVGHDQLAFAVVSLTELRIALADQLSGDAQKALWADGVRLAINQQFLASDWRKSSEEIGPSAEIAFLPPVTGG